MRHYHTEGVVLAHAPDPERQRIMSMRLTMWRMVGNARSVCK